MKLASIRLAVLRGSPPCDRTHGRKAYEQMANEHLDLVLRVAVDRVRVRRPDKRELPLCFDVVAQGVEGICGNHDATERQRALKHWS